MPRPFKVQYQSKAWAKSDRKHFDEDINCNVDDMQMIEMEIPMRHVMKKMPLVINCIGIDCSAGSLLLRKTSLDFAKSRNFS